MILKHPLDTLNDIRKMVAEIYDTPSLLAQIGKNELNKLQNELDKTVNGTAYETGKGIGKLSVEVAIAMAGAGLGEKLAAKVYNEPIN
ncbi:hypothetical protein [Pectinatus sottacetonis]|uniref:hypothetical protein n=1 Tax=Pectinatus sottacetonis TaxID=1002795 RepID=UPI0018C707AE|nr:hypothetical protein [Pectinatus sottacetonis]